MFKVVRKYWHVKKHGCLLRKCFRRMFTLALFGRGGDVYSGALHSTVVASTKNVYVAVYAWDSYVSIPSHARHTPTPDTVCLSKYIKGFRIRQTVN